MNHNLCNSFPVMQKNRNSRPASIPWEMIAPHEKQGKKNHGDQSLEGLAKRGGLDPTELLAVLEDRPWKMMDLEDCNTKIMALMGEYYQRRADFGPNGDATTPGFFKRD